MISTIDKNTIIQTICGKDVSYARRIIEEFGENIDEIEKSRGKDFVLTLKNIIETDDEDLLNELQELYERKERDKSSTYRTRIKRILCSKINGRFIYS